MKTAFSFALLVDDDKTASFIHEHFFKYFQVAHHLHKVANGQEAWRFIQKHWHKLPGGKKLVTIDLSMPVMDGYALLEQLCPGNRQPCLDDMHLVVLTSSVACRDKRLSGQYPLLDYIEKPLTKAKIDRLLKKLRQLPETAEAV